MVRDWTAAGTVVLVRLLFHCVERCSGCIASKCSICVTLWSHYQPLALHPLGSIFSSAPRLFEQRPGGWVRHWVHPLAQLPTYAELYGIPRCFWTRSRLPAPGGDSPELSLHRGGIFLSERRCREHLPVHLMEGQYDASASLRRPWTGAHPGGYQLTSGGTRDRSREHLRNAKVTLNYSFPQLPAASSGETRFTASNGNPRSLTFLNTP